jgi:hypothetical protein
LLPVRVAEEVEGVAVAEVEVAVEAEKDDDEDDDEEVEEELELEVEVEVEAEVEEEVEAEVVELLAMMTGYVGSLESLLQRGRDCISSSLVGQYCNSSSSSA